MEILNSSELINLLIVLGSAAAVAGFMAGLLGVGGGIIMAVSYTHLPLPTILLV